MDANFDAGSDIEQLYTAYYIQVYSFIMSQTKSRDTSEELTQKTFVRAMTTSKPFEGRAQASELTWLCAIAKNLLTDENRKQHRTRPQTQEPASDVNIAQALVDEESAFRVHQALHGLDEPYKEVFQLRVFGELPFQKIGLLFGKTENWARVTFHRARLRLQERMEEE